MKKIFPVIVLLMFVMPFTVNAHTALTASNPTEGEVLVEFPKELELKFGTVIEEGSSMTLNGPEMEVALSDVTVTENVMKGIVAEELKNGQYIISWKIIGGDGHPIEGEILFSLDVAAEEEIEQSVQDEAAVEQALPSSSEQQSTVDGQSEDEGVLAVLFLIAFTVLVGFGSVLLIKMKR